MALEGIGDKIGGVFGTMTALINTDALHIWYNMRSNIGMVYIKYG